MQTTVALEGLEFFAYHGFHDEEQRMGNKYSVDIRIGLPDTKAGQSDNLADTVDYGQLYQIIARRMQQPARLLEHLAHDILQTVASTYPQLLSVEVGVTKYNPPIGGVCTRAQVCVRETFPIVP
jgi:dihydroneopterin aldolase